MKTVVVGLSGGVDSSVAAYLLKKQGYEVIGLHMKSANKDEAESDEKRVRELAKTLGIRLDVVDYSNQMKIVKDYFINEYKCGNTPNPCVICNREVKFKPFIDYANKIGADYFATGHYASIERVDGNIFLKKAADKSKDQTYFLCQLSKEQLSKALFPLGQYTKDEVKQIAIENNLVTEQTKESYDVCFLGSQKFKDFMKNNYPEKSGNIKDIQTGKVVGTHTGISKYTIGQRRGLDIGGINGYEDNRWFVVKKDVKTNTLFVSCGECEEMFSSACIVTDFNWIMHTVKKEFDASVKLRYRQADQTTKVTILDEHTLCLNFEEKQRAVTIGQFAVLYDNEGKCYGGGRISELIK